jgi:Uma2 family endonuclease
VATDVEITRRRFTLDEYHRMIDAGILDEDDRVELIRGEIVQMAPIGSDHASCVARLNHWIVDLEGDAVDIHRKPSSDGFQRIERVLRGATVAPLAFADATLTVAEILG